MAASKLNPSETGLNLRTKFNANADLTDAITEEIIALESEKQVTLESGVNIKTINNQPILGSGNINISGGGGGVTDGDKGDVVVSASGAVWGVPALGFKADLVDDVVPEIQLPPVYFTGLTGSGSLSDPYVVSGGQASPEEWFRTLPGYSDIEDRMLYILSGVFSLGPIPQGGDFEKLATPTLVIDEIAVDAFHLIWDEVINATSYTLHRDTQSSFATAVQVYSGPFRVFTDIGLAANTQYYYRLKANAAGFTASDYGTDTATTLVTGNTTPPAPTNAIVDDTNNVFNWTNATGYGNVSSYEYTLDGGVTYTQATVKPIVVGDIFKAVGQVGVRVKADTGRNASGTLFNPTAFNIAPVKADKPTNPITNNIDHSFDWTNTPGFTLVTQYEYTLDGGATYTVCTEKPTNVGDITKGIGQVGVRVRAAVGVLASDTLYNTVAFVGTDGFVPVTDWIGLTEPGTIVSENNITATTSDRGRTTLRLPAGQIGSVRVSSCKGGAALFSTDPTYLDGSNEEAVKYYFQQNPINLKIQAYSKADGLNVETDAQAGATLTEIEFTLTAVNYYYSESRQLWASTPRTSGEDLYLKMSIGGTVELPGELLNITQKGFS